MFVHRRCYGRTMERSVLAWSQSLHKLCSNMQSEDKNPTCTAAVECEFSPSRLTNLNYWTASASHVLMSSSHHCTQLFPSFMSCLFQPIRHLHCFITIMWWVTLRYIQTTDKCGPNSILQRQFEHHSCYYYYYLNANQAPLICGPNSNMYMIFCNAIVVSALSCIHLTIMSLKCDKHHDSASHGGGVNRYRSPGEQWVLQRGGYRHS